MPSRSVRRLQILALIGFVVAFGFAASVSRPQQTVSQAATSAPQRYSPWPTFNAPPLRAIAGGNVGLSGMYSMAHEDFNGDGIPDLASVGFYCAQPSQGTAAIFLGRGDGTFDPPLYTPAGQCPGIIKTAKLRGSNAPNDLLVVDAAGNKLWVLLGNGNGTFAAPAEVNVGFPVNDVAVADFNEDGKSDLAIGVANLAGPLAIMLGNGNGTFQTATTFPVAPGVISVVVGKFTVTGHNDVLVESEDGIYYARGLGDGTFAPGGLIWQEPNTIFAVTPPGHIANGLQAIALGDFNKDGNLDIAIDASATRVEILLGTGTGTFVPAPIPMYLVNSNQTGFGGGDIAPADLRGTGNLDLVITTGYGATAVVLNGNGDGTFQAPVTYPLPEFNDEVLAVADFNRDGKPDIVVATEGAVSSGDANYLTVMLNNGGGFDPPPSQFVVTSPADQGTAENPIGVLLDDLNGDGKLDLVVTLWGGNFGPIIDGKVPNPPQVNPQTQQVTTQGSIAVLLGNGDGSFGAAHYYLVGTRPLGIKTADLTGDGKKDIVVTNAITNTLSVLKANGDGTFQSAIDLSSGTAPNALAIADVNGDGKPDLIATNNGDQTVGVYMNNSAPGEIHFAVQVTYPVGLYPSGVVAGDFNGDGKIDMAVLNNGDVFVFSSPTTIVVLLNNGNGTFTAQPAQQVWNHNGGDAIAIGDFTGTGRLDLAVANFGYAVANEVRIMRGNGDGTFTAAESYGIGEGAEDIKVADFNGDGIMDLATCNLNDNTITLLVGKGDGTFVPAVDASSDTPVLNGFPAFGYPTFLALGDVNSDGKPDLVTANIFNRTVTVLQNTTVTLADILKLLKIVGITRMTNGHVRLACQGLPNRTVLIQAASDPNASSFATVGSVNVDSSGIFQFEDSGAANATTRFYRLALP